MSSLSIETNRRKLSMELKILENVTEIRNYISNLKTCTHCTKLKLEKRKCNGAKEKTLKY